MRRPPHLDIRQQVVYAGDDEIDSASFCRIENVFLKGIKALSHLLLQKSDLKKAFSLKSVVESNEATSADASLDRDSLVTIPRTIRDQCCSQRIDDICRYHTIVIDDSFDFYCIAATL